MEVVASFKVTLEKKCFKCKSVTHITVDANDYKRVTIDGELIQNAMGYLSEDERELLISGICGKCFDEIFADEAEDDEDDN